MGVRLCPVARGRARGRPGAGQKTKTPGLWPGDPVFAVDARVRPPRREAAVRGAWCLSSALPSHHAAGVSRTQSFTGRRRASDTQRLPDRCPAPVVKAATTVPRETEYLTK